MEFTPCKEVTPIRQNGLMDDEELETETLRMS